MSKISIIIPMKNEQDGVAILFDRLCPILRQLPLEYEIIVINDGSNDNTLSALITQKNTCNKLIIIDLSRNFGKEAAVYAGLAQCGGDCAVIIDADLQDPPEIILEMVHHYLEGFEVVTAVRKSRELDNYIKKQTASLFYKLINKISSVKLTANAGDYRLLSRPAIEAFLQLGERVRFNKGLFAWIGFKEKLLYHDRYNRAKGCSKWSYWNLCKFAIDGITSFSKAPLEIWFYLGILIATCGFFYAVYYFVKTIIWGIDVHGYPSLLIFILFFSGLQMISIGILGKYIGRIFIEVKRRPLYIIKNIYD